MEPSGVWSPLSTNMPWTAQLAWFSNVWTDRPVGYEHERERSTRGGEKAASEFGLPPCVRGGLTL